MSNWYRQLKTMMESVSITESDAPYNVTFDDADGVHQRRRFDDLDWAREVGRKEKGNLWHRDTHLHDYSIGDDDSHLDQDGEPEILDEVDAPAQTEPCIPRIAFYNDDGNRHYEALLFFPAIDANIGKIVCFDGQHNDASMDFFQRRTYRVTPANLVRAGLSQDDFDRLVRIWESNGPEHGTVKIYNRDQPAFREQRWHR